MYFVYFHSVNKNSQNYSMALFRVAHLERRRGVLIAIINQQFGYLYYSLLPSKRESYCSTHDTCAFQTHRATTMHQYILASTMTTIVTHIFFISKILEVYFFPFHTVELLDNLEPKLKRAGAGAAGFGRIAQSMSRGPHVPWLSKPWCALLPLEP